MTCTHGAQQPAFCRECHLERTCTDALGTLREARDVRAERDDEQTRDYETFCERRLDAAIDNWRSHHQADGMVTA